MLFGLMLAAFLMGLGGMPHCAAMCGAACAAALPRGLPPLALLGRCLGYTAMGAVAALSSGSLAQWARQVTVLQPFWTLAQVAAVVLGGWLLLTGRIPAAVDAFGQRTYWALRRRAQVALGTERAARYKPCLPLLAGLAWAALPCGLLYAALTLAALASGALGGSLVMLSFALPSAVGVWFAPMVLSRLARPGQVTAGPHRSTSVVPVIWFKNATDATGNGVSGAMFDEPADAALRWKDQKWAVRISGLFLAASSAWAVQHQLWAQWRAWCA